MRRVCSDVMNGKGGDSPFCVIGKAGEVHLDGRSDLRTTSNFEDKSSWNKDLKQHYPEVGWVGLVEFFLNT